MAGSCSKYFSAYGASSAACSGWAEAGRDLQDAIGAKLVGLGQQPPGLGLVRRIADRRAAAARPRSGRRRCCPAPVQRRSAHRRPGRSPPAGAAPASAAPGRPAARRTPALPSSRSASRSSCSDVTAVQLSSCAHASCQSLPGSAPRSRASAGSAQRRPQPGYLRRVRGHARSAAGRDSARSARPAPRFPRPSRPRRCATRPGTDSSPWIAMSSAALQHTVRASESVKSPIEVISVASERSSNLPITKSRSSSLSRIRSGRGMPVSSGTTVRSPVDVQLNPVRAHQLRRAVPVVQPDREVVRAQRRDAQPTPPAAPRTR